MLALCIGTISFAQTAENPWSVGLNFNPKEYKGELGNSYFKFKNWNLNPGLTVNRYVNDFLDVNLGGNYGKYSYSSDSGSFKSNLLDLGLKARVKLNNGKVLKKDARLAPYLTAGLGFNILDHVNQNIDNANFLNIPLGGGIRWNYNDWFSIGYELTHNLNLNDEYDFSTSESGNDSYLAHQIGMNFGLNLNGSGSSKVKDSDGDGVADAIDKCPNTAKGEAVTANGCPKYIEEIRSLAKNIYFETASDVIKTESHKSLNQVASILAAHPETNLTIEGHTDNQGDAAMNLDLSKRRAQSVLNYLSAKGIDVSHLKAEGYGETKPIADNGTKEGRALNRRVELLLSF